MTVLATKPDTFSPTQDDLLAWVERRQLSGELADFISTTLLLEHQDVLETFDPVSVYPLVDRIDILNRDWPRDDAYRPYLHLYPHLMAFRAIFTD